MLRKYKKFKMEHNPQNYKKLLRRKKIKKNWLSQSAFKEELSI